MRNHQQYLTKTSVISKVTANHNWLMKWIYVSFIGLSLTLFALINLAQADEVNPYAKNYKGQNTGNLKSQNPNPDTKIFVSNHKEEDNISMLENGYDLIGTSGFSATEASPGLALQHAKAIKADTVLVYKKYESAATASSKLQLIKEAAKKGGEIDPNDLEEGPTQYQYFAS
ncbi:MAG: PDZ domain-containing protein, partial [Methylotenera sp.]